MSSPSDYLVGVTIGEGSYGRVVHARHKDTNRNVAIKVIDKLSIKKKPHLFQSVWTERKLLSEWDSDYIVKLWASFHDDECLYLVMECITGGDLTYVSRKGQQDPVKWSSSIAHYGLQLVNALEFIHSKNVIHADLKPDNVLVTNCGRIKLSDFGSAVCLQSTHQNDKLPVMGTADYASPEVIRASKDLSVAVDLWSLGCIFYALWVGQSPFHAESDALAIQAVLDYSASKDTVFVTKNIKDRQWQEIITGLLSPDASQRIGVSDAASPQDQSVSYHSIRSFPVWDGVNLAQDPPFVPPAPQWWLQAQTSSMRDGSMGWGAFLL